MHLLLANDLAEFLKLHKALGASPKSWSVDLKSIDQTTFDLSVKNPNGGEEIAYRSPQVIMDEIAALDAESAEVLGNIKALLRRGHAYRDLKYLLLKAQRLAVTKTEFIALEKAA